MNERGERRAQGERREAGGRGGEGDFVSSPSLSLLTEREWARCVLKNVCDVFNWNGVQGRRAFTQAPLSGERAGGRAPGGVERVRKALSQERRSSRSPLSSPLPPPLPPPPENTAPATSHQNFFFPLTPVSRENKHTRHPVRTRPLLPADPGHAHSPLPLSLSLSLSPSLSLLSKRQKGAPTRKVFLLPSPGACACFRKNSHLVFYVFSVSSLHTIPLCFPQPPVFLFCVESFESFMHVVVVVPSLCIQ